MSTFGNSLWGGGGAGTGTPNLGVPVRPFLYMALRLAGVTQRPDGSFQIPSPDQLSDAIVLANLMISQANTKRTMMYTTSILELPLTAAQKVNTIGSYTTTTWQVPRPEKIKYANLVLNTSGTPVRLPIYIATDQEWADIAVQDIPGAIPRLLYCDYAMPISTIYLVPQDQGGDTLELFVWPGLPQLVTPDDLIVFAPGYDDWFTQTLGIRLASAFHLEVGDDLRTAAQAASRAIQSRNGQGPRGSTDYPHGRGNSGSFNYFDGMDR